MATARRKSGRRAARVEALDPEGAARAAGLTYVSDEVPGIGRRKAGRGFAYTGPDGAPVRDAKMLRRIRALAVPPAWTDVWICPSARGHIQATGRDARGRKQYRYHAYWRQTRDRTKFDRMAAFGAALPGIRRRVREDLALGGLPKEKVLATIVRLLDLTYIRVGNRRYARDNRSFGLTTMRNGHADVSGETISFEFRGKGGKVHSVDVRDPRVARIIKRCQEIPGQLLFQYLDVDGERRPIASDDVNAYLQEITGEDFTAKDFRTWAGTVLAVRALRGVGAASTEKHARSNILEAIGTVAEALGNTVAVCRACYVHPLVVDAYLDGSLPAMRRRRSPAGVHPDDRLRPDEATLLAFLRSGPGPEKLEKTLKRSVGAAKRARKAA
jgi:DNA topoisomerase I